MVIRNYVFAIALVGVSYVGSSQSFNLYLQDSLNNPIDDIVIFEWKGATWLSNFDGTAALPDRSIDSLLIHSMSYHDTLVAVEAGDTITLWNDVNILNEIVVLNRSKLEYIDHRRPRYQFQREPGDYYLLGYYATGYVVLDSLTVHITQVIRSSSRLRIVIWKDGTFLFQSDIYSIPDDLVDDRFVLPIGFYTPMSGEIYIGIQFLEVGRDPFTARSHMFQNRGKGNVYTPANTGITLGGIRLKEGERVLSASYFNDQLRIQHLDCQEFRRKVPYIGIHYFGSGELLTNFDDIED